MSKRNSIRVYFSDSQYERVTKYLEDAEREKSDFLRELMLTHLRKEEAKADLKNQLRQQLAELTS